MLKTYVESLVMLTNAYVVEGQGGLRAPARAPAGWPKGRSRAPAPPYLRQEGLTGTIYKDFNKILL